MRIPTEMEEQKKLFAYASYHPLLKYFMFAIPNGGSRNIIEAKNLKQSGVKKGIPDIFIAIPMNGFNGLFLELKRIKKSSISVHQKNMISLLESNGYKCCICYGCDNAIKEIENYLN